MGLTHPGEFCLPMETYKHTPPPGTPCPPCHGETPDLFQQDRLKDWIQLLADVLQQEGLPKANGVLQSGQEVPVTELGHLQAVFSLLKGSRGGQGSCGVLPPSQPALVHSTPLTGLIYLPGAAEIIAFLAQLDFGHFGKFIPPQ